MDAGGAPVQAVNGVPAVLRRGRVLPDLRHRRRPGALARRVRPPPRRARRVTHPRIDAPAVRGAAHRRPPVRQPTTTSPWSPCSACWGCGSSRPPAADVEDADPRTTMRYDRARQNLDRHPNYILAADMAAGTQGLHLAHAEISALRRAEVAVHRDASAAAFPQRVLRPCARRLRKRDRGRRQRGEPGSGSVPGHARPTATVDRPDARRPISGRDRIVGLARRAARRREGADRSRALVQPPPAALRRDLRCGEPAAPTGAVVRGGDRTLRLGFADLRRDPQRLEVLRALLVALPSANSRRRS